MTCLLCRSGVVRKIPRGWVAASLGTVNRSRIPVMTENAFPSFLPAGSLFTSPASRAFAKRNPEPLDTKDDDDKPIQYSSSKAFRQRVLNLEEDDIHAVLSRRVIISSLAVFMLYFFYLREENDVDRQMKIPLWEKIPGLERQTLQALIEHKKRSGLDARVEQARLKQVLKEEDEGLGASFRKLHEQPPPVVRDVGPLTSLTAPDAVPLERKLVR